MFGQIKKKAGIKTGTFHDFCRTAITNWFYEGLEITEVMRLAGHSKYDTTLRYYLAVKDDLIDRGREAQGQQGDVGEVFGEGGGRDHTALYYARLWGGGVV